jgi:transposase-like protein
MEKTRGRKTTGELRYSRALGAAICQRLAQGETWSLISREEDLPAYTTLYAWRRRHPEFAEMLAEAREMAADRHADKALAVAEETTAATVQADRLKVGTLMKHAAVGAPHRWGAKAEAAEPPQKKPALYVRRFERVVLEDGAVAVREVFR